jgi:hypothetical protein
VAEVLADCKWDRIPERALPLLAELVMAGAALEARAGDAEMGDVQEGWDEALRRVGRESGGEGWLIPRPGRSTPSP